MSTPQPPAEAEYHVCEYQPSDELMDRAVEFWRPHLGRSILDIGCGEGHLLSALCRAGYSAQGVDLTLALVERARARGLAVAHQNAVEYISQQGAKFDTFLMLDFVEHIPFGEVSRILAALPPGGRCIIQTPNVNSIIGHQFYLQVPGHVTPLSPAVLGKMFERARMDVTASGTIWGGVPWTGIRRKITLFLLEKLFGVSMLHLFVEGANYYAVAQKRRDG
jgi:SAM-dependent methyltransferase